MDVTILLCLWNSTVQNGASVTRGRRHNSLRLTNKPRNTTTTTIIATGSNNIGGGSSATKKEKKLLQLLVLEKKNLLIVSSSGQQDMFHVSPFLPIVGYVYSINLPDHVTSRHELVESTTRTNTNPLVCLLTSSYNISDSASIFPLVVDLQVPCYTSKIDAKH